MLNDQSCNNCRPNQHSGSFFFLICDRYCCWGKPFWWFEGSLLLHPQGDLKQTFSKMYTFLFSQGTLLAIAGTYVTYMYFGLQVCWDLLSFWLIFFFFRLALCLPTKQVVWRRSTSSSTTRVAWIALNVIPQIHPMFVNLSTFQNGLIARMKQVPRETNTKSFLRWEHHLLIHKILHVTFLQYLFIW